MIEIDPRLRGASFGNRTLKTGIFPTDPVERAVTIFGAFGRTESQSLALACFGTDPLSAPEAFKIFLKVSNRVWVPKSDSTMLSYYLRAGFVPNGFVRRVEDVDSGESKYRARFVLTEAGLEYAQPIAYFLLRESLQLDDVLSKTFPQYFDWRDLDPRAIERIVNPIMRVLSGDEELLAEWREIPWRDYAPQALERHVRSLLVKSSDSPKPRKSRAAANPLTKETEGKSLTIEDLIVAQASKGLPAEGFVDINLPEGIGLQKLEEMEDPDADTLLEMDEAQLNKLGAQETGNANVDEENISDELSDAYAERYEAQRVVETTWEDSPDALSIYLREVGRTTLITKSEEVDLAKAYEQGMNARVTLEMSQAIDQEKRKGLEEEEFRGEEARKKMIEANLRLAIYVAKKYLGRGMPLLDLIQEGNLGLDRAVKKFDYSRGFKFSTYAHWWIRQSVSRGVAEQSRVIRVPVHMVEQIGKMYNQVKVLEQELGRDPDDDEVAERMNKLIEIQNEEREEGKKIKEDWTKAKVQQTRRAAQNPISLETPVGEDGAHTIADMVPDLDVEQPQDSAEQAMLGLELKAALSDLSERERRVLDLRFGLGDGRQRTLGEIGDEIGVTRERVRQIENEALQKLRKRSLRTKVLEYL